MSGSDGAFSELEVCHCTSLDALDGPRVLRKKRLIIAPSKCDPSDGSLQFFSFLAFPLCRLVPFFFTPPPVTKLSPPSPNEETKKGLFSEDPELEFFLVDFRFRREGFF